MQWTLTVRLCATGSSQQHYVLSAVKLTASLHAGVPACRYEGTVECMTREEWGAQAKSLWGDLIDERGRLKICREVDRRLNTSSIEGAAQATLETVYGPNNLRCIARTHALYTLVAMHVNA